MRSISAVDRPIEFVQRTLDGHVGEGHIVVDATIGNGHDTLLLARLVGPNGHVFGFDIQPLAVESTKSLLVEAGVTDRATLFLVGHENMSERVPRAWHGRIRAVTFNLGYLPGSDKSVVTRPETTIPALRQATALLDYRGLVSIMVYPGHAGGEVEADAVLQWCRSLTVEEFDVLRLECFNRPRAPFAVLVTDRRSDKTVMQQIPRLTE